VDRIDVLIRIADIDLYLGELSRASEHGSEALAVAGQSGTVSQRARCIGILGAAAFFGGDVDEGKRRFEQALSLLTGAADDERDQTILTTVLGNLGGVAEAAGTGMGLAVITARRCGCAGRRPMRAVYCTACTPWAGCDRPG
jgi:hypothetical protein